MLRLTLFLVLALAGGSLAGCPAKPDAAAVDPKAQQAAEPTPTAPPRPAGADPGKTAADDWAEGKK
jgi:hypothetical protein